MFYSPRVNASLLTASLFCLIRNKTYFKDIKNSAIREKNVVVVLDLQLQEKRTFLQDMKKINSRSTADISYVKEKWLAFTSHLKAIFFSALKYATQKY